MQHEWPFLYDESTDSLYHHTHQGYTQHAKLQCDYDKTLAEEVSDPVISERAVPVNVIEY